MSETERKTGGGGGRGGGGGGVCLPASLSAGTCACACECGCGPFQTPVLTDDSETPVEDRQKSLPHLSLWNAQSTPSGTSADFFVMMFFAMIER